MPSMSRLRELFSTCRSRCAYAALIASAACLLFGSLPAHAQMHPVATPGLLDPDTIQHLVAQHARVGRVDIVVENVFDTTDPQEDSSLYKAANHIHLKTRENVLRNMILFDQGDEFDPRTLEESARLLRSRGWISDAAVLPIAYDGQSNTVDVLITIRDSWSLSLNMSFGRNGGTNDVGFGLEEKNVLGTGKKLQLTHQSDVDRDQNILAYHDENVLGSRVRLDAAYADTSDGKERHILTGRPFFSLGTRWSVLGQALEEDRIDRMYDQGEIVDAFEHRTRATTIEGGWSRGLIDQTVKRWRLGLTYNEHEFAPALDLPPPLVLPENRKLVYPWVGFQVIHDDFRQFQELNDIGRVEDIQLGLNLEGSIGYAPTQLGADRDAWLFDFAAHKGWEPGSGQLMLVDFGASTRHEYGELANTIIKGGARYYLKTFPKQLFLIAVDGTVTRSLDQERQVLLGGDTGLRGYPLRYQSGDKRALLTLEERFFSDWYPFHLIRVGYAAFVDAGRTWGEDPRGSPSQGMLYDAGVGLRLSSPRSSGRSVVHVDLAFPLNGDPAIDSVQLIIETKSSF
jgi:hemolysin activation/secretion protein